MAETKYTGSNALTYIFTIIKQFVTGQLGNYVTKESGKGLSSNDFTTEEKNKLSGIASGAQVNVIEKVSVNGSQLPVSEKGVSVTIPTKTSDLTNDSGYLNAVPSEYVTDSELTSKGYQNASQVDSAIVAKGYQTQQQVQEIVNNAIGGVTGASFEVVDELPSSGNPGTIYLIAHQHGAQDGYDEYIWVSGAWEKIGNTDIDLSQYVLQSDLVEISNSEIQQLWDSVS